MKLIRYHCSFVVQNGIIYTSMNGLTSLTCSKRQFMEFFYHYFNVRSQDINTYKLNLIKCPANNGYYYIK